MARLDPSPYPGQWEFQSGEDFDKYRHRVDALLEAIPADRLIKFPVADGYALYYVKSEKPLVLQHVPCGDAWRVHEAMIRGLQLEEVQRMVRAEKALRGMFDAASRGARK